MVLRVEVDDDELILRVMIMLVLGLEEVDNVVFLEYDEND